MPVVLIIRTAQRDCDINNQFFVSTSGRDDGVEMSTQYTILLVCLLVLLAHANLQTLLYASAALLRYLYIPHHSLVRCWLSNFHLAMWQICSQDFSSSSRHQCILVSTSRVLELIRYCLGKARRQEGFFGSMTAPRKGGKHTRWQSQVHISIDGPTKGSITCPSLLP